MSCPPDKPFCELIAALGTVLDMEDETKLYHAWRVALVAQKLAQDLLPQEEALVFYAALLHDVGGIGLPDHIVHKAVQPRAEDDPEIRQHPQRGAEMVRLLPVLGPLLAPMVEQHHEHWDGSGYPRGLKNGEIHPGALLISISDIFDLRLRVAKVKAWEKIRPAMAALSGKVYPPELWEAFDRLMGSAFWEEVATDSNIEAHMEAIHQALPPVEGMSGDFLKATISLFANIIDAKHAYTGGHSHRVAAYALKLAKALGLKEEEREKLEIASLLHDFGKVAVPRSVLDKPGPLDPHELEVVRRHPTRTIALLKQVSGLRELAEIAGLHHERYDGKGYPYGLKGEEIPLPSRILAVADAFDAMTSRRPYQPIRTPQEALERLRQGAGTQFDPQVVEVAQVLVENKG
ncbi:HD domain-containing protein [Thermanaeromonas toyohensis ToBE]|uniref:HD domain-containing protein n=1 Tax=Thermanaeromonas toyohensis ToBE TaxID=698762 RepID=A0A1W1V4Z5_9FIRM|nr:HD-GYP domain-containing protein [Thermanaeromonas toyohensis]SMB88489.1 HD domain-containing protein [Thermanaeromonas toyohensis ToBE]